MCIKLYQEAGIQLLLLLYYKSVTSSTDLLDTNLKVSTSTIENWLKQDFPDTAVSPHLSDYCPTCFEFKMSLNSLKIQINMHKVMFHFPVQTKFTNCISNIKIQHM